MYSGVLFNHKKEYSNVIYSIMPATRDHDTKRSKSERDEYHLMSLIYGI